MCHQTTSPCLVINVNHVKGILIQVDICLFYCCWFLVQFGHLCLLICGPYWSFISHLRWLIPRQGPSKNTQKAAPLLHGWGATPLSRPSAPAPPREKNWGAGNLGTCVCGPVVRFYPYHIFPVFFLVDLCCLKKPTIILGDQLARYYYSACFSNGNAAFRKPSLSRPLPMWKPHFLSVFYRL